MNTYIFNVVYELDPAYYIMSDDDSGLRSAKVKIKAQSQEDAEDEIEESYIDPIHSIQLIETVI